MGVVYQAKHLLMNRIVAIKMLRGEQSGDEKSFERFKQEARAISVLDHPNIVSIHDFGISSQGQPYLVMDFLDGTSLNQVVTSNGPLPWQRAVQIFLQAAAALAHAHKHGILHRDIKPGNILLLSGEKADLVKIVDFGIAKIFDPANNASQRLTATGELLLSPVYMSPEQCVGRSLDARSDIYSLGCVMYNVLAGIPPFAGVTAAETVSKHILDTPKAFSAVHPETSVPEALEEMILKALNKDPSKRQQSMQELILALQSLHSDSSNSDASARAGWTQNNPTASKESAARSQARNLPGKASTAVAISIAVLLLGGSILCLQWRAGDTVPADETARLLQAADEESKHEDWDAASDTYKNLLALQIAKYGEHTSREITIRTKLAIALHLAGHKNKSIECYNEVRGQLLDLAKTYDDSGKLTDRLACLRQLHSLQEQLDLKDSIDYDDNNKSLASVAMDLHQYDQAAQYLSQSLAFEKKTRPADDPDLAELKRKLAQALILSKKSEEGTALMLEAIPYLDESSPTREGSRTWAYFDLATAYKNLKNEKEAERIWSEIAKRPGFSALINQSNWLLANLLVDEKRYKDAEVYARKWVDSIIAAEGYSTKDSFLRQMDWLNDIYMQAGDLDECQKLFEKCFLAIESNGQSAASAVKNLGLKYSSHKRPDKAEQLYSWYLARAKNINAEQKLFLLDQLGEQRVSLNKLSEATTPYKEAFALCDTTGNKDQGMCIQVIRDLASCYYLQHHWIEAARLNLRWLEYAEKYFGPNSREALECLCFSTSTYFMLGQQDKVMTTAQAFFARQSNHKISDSLNFEELRLLMLSYDQQKNYTQAVRFAEQLKPACTNKEIDRRGRLNVLTNYQQYLLKLNRPAEAAELNKEIELVKNETRQ